MKYYSKFLDFIQFVFKWAMIIAMFTFTAVIIVSVFYRYVLENSLTWSEQVARFLFVWVIMMGVPVIYRDKTATYLDLLVDLFPPVPKQITAIIMDILIAIFGGFYGYCGLRYTIKAGATIFQGLNIPAGYIYASEIVCGVVVVLVAIESIYYSSKGLVDTIKGKEAEV
jgi:TRAP-type C4-dicarboxylate transport system permease small subunit